MDPVTDVFTSDCPGREVLDHITGRWGLLIVAALKDGPLRFSQLRDRIGGVSEKMLAQTLRVLHRDGLIERNVEHSRPPKVCYELTPLGSELIGPLCELVQWIARRTPDIVAAQRRHDQSGSHTATGSHT
ncbi:winged helix-turn-helix transcriptional regulator [Thermoactinospora rubra]|uniref:winged helix-turn-helix transcriptional regulator n=1 Tax=Thermoactinospora rubra TaxID=1088767 RepID=UPI000A12277C|nr:helix-turn-helix domain-containing protein [Thermoactinospora rubra]